MTTATVQTYVNICELPGAELDIGRCRWSEDERAANCHFAMMLGEVTGRLEVSGGGGYIVRGLESGWLKLADVDTAALEAIVRRMQRSHPPWRLHADDTLPVHGRIQVHFNTAQARWLKERVG
jgi:hypothetical protein